MNEHIDDGPTDDSDTDADADVEEEEEEGEYEEDGEESSFGGDCVQWGIGNSPPHQWYEQPEEEVLLVDQSMGQAHADVGGEYVDHPGLSIDHKPEHCLTPGAVPVIIPRPQLSHY